MSSIGVLATSGSTTTTYPVTIALDSPDLGGLSGVDGDVRIVTQRSVDVTTVQHPARLDYELRIAIPFGNSGFNHSWSASVL